MQTAHLDVVERASLALSARLSAAPELLLTLGSGLADVADAIENPIDIPVAAVPGLAVSTVPGHAGTIRAGTLGGRQVLAQMGRSHLYEGHEPADVSRMVDIAASLGCTTYVVTNAAGGIDPSFTPGDIMLIADHINLTGGSPLTGIIRDGSPVFLDMADAYSARLRGVAHEVAGRLEIALQEGVYAGLRGPTFETPAEVGMLRVLGANAVGMSTVLEVIAARSHGMDVLGISSITNVHGVGIATSHAEVLEVGKRVARDVARLLLTIIPELPPRSA